MIAASQIFGVLTLGNRYHQLAVSPVVIVSRAQLNMPVAIAKTNRVGFVCASRNGQGVMYLLA